jgi:hypothetical protein
MNRRHEVFKWNHYMSRKIDELSHGNSHDCTTEQIVQIASQLDDGERIYCRTDITAQIELVVNISNQLEHDALMLLNWHTKDHGLAVGGTRFPGEAKSLMQVLGEYPAQRWSVTNGRSFSGVQHEEPTRE